MGDGLACEFPVVHNFGIDGFGLQRCFHHQPADQLDLTQKAVPPPCHGFDITRIVGRFPERVAQLLNGGVDAVIELHDGVVRPKAEANLLAQHHLAGMLQQHTKDAAGLFPQAEPDAVFAQLTRSNVEFEWPEAKYLGLRSS